MVEVTAKILIRKETIEQMYDSGMSSVQIANELGCCSSTILNKMAEYGIRTRNMSDARKGRHNINRFYIDRDVLFTLYIEERKTSSQVASILGCSNVVVLARLREFDIDIRDIGDSHRRFFIDADVLRDMYTNKLMSVDDIGNEFGCSSRVIFNRMTLYGIQTRSVGGHNDNYVMSDESRKRISVSRLGDKNHSWRGGISFGKYCPKFNNEVKQYIRDKYCNCDFMSGIHYMICNDGRMLDVHHIDYAKQQGCDDHEWRLVPLSRVNHGRTNFNRPFWNKLLVYALEYDSIYDDGSVYDVFDMLYDMQVIQ